MKFNLLLAYLTFFAVNSLAGTAQIKVIYGDDNRIDVVDSVNPIYSTLAESSAAMIKNVNLIEYNALQYELSGRTLVDMGMCESERFSKQPTSATCSGFLVASDTIVTAGHCVQSQNDCDSRSWVFDYKVDREDDSQVIVDKEQVYKCSKIISQELDFNSEVDYAVIKLDRKVEDRAPLKFRTKGKVVVGDSLVVIGHPSGLPTKIADGANVRSVNDVYFKANLDTYGGNSGSAVFNATTGVIEGILVRGETDYVGHSEKNCKISNVFASDDGDGEDVTLITIVKGLPTVKPPKPPKPEPPVVIPDENKKPRRGLLARIGRFFRRLFS